MDSIDYLRKTGFFKDYSNLTSEEILEKIFSGEIDKLSGSSRRKAWGRKSIRRGGEYSRATFEGFLEELEDYWTKRVVYDAVEKLMVELIQKGLLIRWPLK